MDELRTLDLPRKPIVLINPLIGRIYDLIMLFMLKQHPYHRGLRQDGVDAPGNALVTRRLADGPREARAVVIMHGNNALLHLDRRLGCAVNCEVAAFGMPAHAQRFVAVLARHARQVVYRLPLRGDLLKKAHVEILLPTHECIIRPAEGNIDAAVAKVDRQRSELLLDRIIEQRGIAVERHGSKARTVHQLFQKLHDRAGYQHAHIVSIAAVAGKIQLRRLAQQNTATDLGRRHDPLEIDEAQLCKDKRIYLVEG